jgi:hypothetical protein
VAASQTGALVAGGAGVAAALTGGFRVVFGISTGLLVAGILLSAVVLQPAAGEQPSGEEEAATGEDAAA